MADVCEKHDLKLLVYGTLVGCASTFKSFTTITLTLVPQCGGFLSDTWLSQPEPAKYDSSLTPSQRKVPPFRASDPFLSILIDSTVPGRDRWGLG